MYSRHQEQVKVVEPSLKDIAKKRKVKKEILLNFYKEKIKQL